MCEYINIYEYIYIYTLYTVVFKNVNNRQRFFHFK